MARALDKYLADWAEPETRVAELLDGDWEQVIVVPSCNESAQSLAGLERPSRRVATLAIVVVNGRDEHPIQVHAANESMLAELGANARELAPGVFLRRGAPDLLVIDRASPGRRLPVGQGVGLSRKLGCDLALALRDRIRSRWIHSTDADATLPDDYFAADAGPTATGMVRPFVHRGDDPVLRDATWRHEIWLRYYVLALDWAGSPYAFHTIGSCLSIDGEAYAAVRGFPRLQGGEDFYLLNKLAKLGTIHRHEGTPIEIAARKSDRVPFGTGPAVARLLRTSEGPGVYAPEIFVALRAWHRLLDRVIAEGSWDESPLAELEPELHRTLIEGLDALGARVALRDLVDRHGGETLRVQVWGWFDAFRTLKLVHGLRSAGFADRPWREVLDRAPFTPQAGEDPVEIVRERLAAAERGRHGQ